jgi:hypothetical protein
MMVMRRAVYISLSVASLLTLVLLGGCVFVPVEYEETQTTISPGESLQIEIDVNANQTLMGDWRADGEISGSYSGPNNDHRVWQTTGGRNDFTISGEFNPGLYTFKFRNDGSEATPVLFRYRFQ